MAPENIPILAPKSPQNSTDSVKICQITAPQSDSEKNSGQNIRPMSNAPQIPDIESKSTPVGQNTDPKPDLSPPKNPVFVPVSNPDRQITDPEAKPNPQGNASRVNSVNNLITTLSLPLSPKPALPSQKHWETSERMKFERLYWFRLIEHDDEYWCRDEEGEELFRVVVESWGDYYKSAVGVWRRGKGEFLYSPKTLIYSGPFNDPKFHHKLKVGEKLCISKSYEDEIVNASGQQQVIHFFTMLYGNHRLSGSIHGFFYIEPKQDSIK